MSPTEMQEFMKWFRKQSQRKETFNLINQLARKATRNGLIKRKAIISAILRELAFKYFAAIKIPQNQGKFTITPQKVNDALARVVKLHEGDAWLGQSQPDYLKKKRSRVKKRILRKTAR